MYSFHGINKFISFKYFLISIIFLNIYFLYTLNLSYYDQIINLMISYGIYIYYLENSYKVDKNIFFLQPLFSFILLLFILYRSFWLHIGDNFIYLFFPLTFFNLVLINYKWKNILKNYKPILISLLFPISKILFIPISIILSPFSTLFTWLFLNALGFTSIMKGQEIFINNSGINVTFSCSGSGQILFCLTAMVIFNYFFPLNNLKLFLLQMSLAFLFTFAFNIIRLCLLAIYSNTANQAGFSIFDYLHSGNGGLVFSFCSMLISCESYKRLYLKHH